MLRYESIMQLLTPFVPPEEENGRLGEGPFQMDVADLGVPGCGLLPSRFPFRFDQPAIGDEILNLGETTDIVDLVEKHQGENLPDAGDGIQQVQGMRIMTSGGLQYGKLQTLQHPVIEIEHPNADVLPIRFDHLEKGIGRCRRIAVDENLTLRVDDADVHRLGAQVNAAEIPVLFGVEYCGASSFC